MHLHLGAVAIMMLNGRSRRPRAFTTRVAGEGLLGHVLHKETGRRNVAKIASWRLASHAHLGTLPRITSIGTQIPAAQAGVAVMNLLRVALVRQEDSGRKVNQLALMILVGVGDLQGLALQELPQELNVAPLADASRLVQSYTW